MLLPDIWLTHIATKLCWLDLNNLREAFGYTSPMGVLLHSIDTQTDRLETIQEVSNWLNAFGEGTQSPRSVLSSKVSLEKFTAMDVVHVYAMQKGEKDGSNWICAGRLKDRRFFFLSAGCDYTGWDCRSWGDVLLSDNLAILVGFGMTERDRDALGAKLEAEDEGFTMEQDEELEEYESDDST